MNLSQSIARDVYSSDSTKPPQLGQLSNIYNKNKNVVQSLRNIWVDFNIILTFLFGCVFYLRWAWTD